MNGEKIKIGIWGAVGGAIITMIVGFSWGGWVFGSTSIHLAEDQVKSAIIERLAPMCVAQFNQDPDKEKKRGELKLIDYWSRDKFIKEQGWATMPFETIPDSQIAEKCAKMILESS